MNTRRVTSGNRSSYCLLVASLLVAFAWVRNPSGVLAGPDHLSVTIDNQAPRRDTDGQVVDAHDGSLEYFQGKFYLYGTHYGATNGLGKTNFFVCYSSTDLTHWKFEGKLFSGPPRVYYRPHVKYNARTKKYVLWYNADNEYGVAISEQPQGPFRIVNPNVPLKFSGHGVGDFDLFVDDDGTGYIAYSADIEEQFEAHAVDFPRHHRISVERLAPDFLSSTYKNSGFLAGNVEAPALFRRNNVYYLLFDNTCGFCTNGSGARVYSSKRPLGPYWYQDNINIAPGPGPGTDHGSGHGSSQDGRSWTPTGSGRRNVILPAQQLGVAEVPTVSGTLFMWMGDRWNSSPDGIKGHDFQVWVPLVFEGDKILPLQKLPRWAIDLRMH